MLGTAHVEETWETGDDPESDDGEADEQGRGDGRGGIGGGEGEGEGGGACFGDARPPGRSDRLPAEVAEGR